MQAEDDVTRRSALRALKRVLLDCGSAAPVAALVRARQPDSGHFPLALAAVQSLGTPSLPRRRPVYGYPVFHSGAGALRTTDTNPRSDWTPGVSGPCLSCRHLSDTSLHTRKLTA